MNLPSTAGDDCVLARQTAARGSGSIFSVSVHVE